MILMARPRPFAKPTDFGCGSPQNIIVWCGNFYAVLAWLIIVWWTVKAPQEGTIKHQTAEAIADITSSGETLRANHLRILQDGLVLKSQATLFRARGELLNPQRAEVLEALKARLQL
jgi:hypothetical protein